MSHIHWVARQNKLEIPRDKDEVNKREIHKCHGRAHDPDTMVAPLTPKPTRKEMVAPLTPGGSRTFAKKKMITQQLEGAFAAPALAQGNPDRNLCGVKSCQSSISRSSLARRSSVLMCMRMREVEAEERERERREKGTMTDLNETWHE
jgi:hypothetical protein